MNDTVLTAEERETLAQMRAESANMDWYALPEDRRSFYRRIIELGFSENEPATIAPLRIIRKLRGQYLAACEAYAAEVEAKRALVDALDEELLKVGLGPDTGLDLRQRVTGLVAGAAGTLHLLGEP